MSQIPMQTQLHHEGREKARPKSLQIKFEWEQKEEIGKGSFGSVFRALKKSTGEMLAVKRLHLTGESQALEDTKSEIELLSDLGENKFVVKLIGYQIKDKSMFIFMEYVERGSIESELRNKNYGKMSERIVAKYSYQILQGLIHLHSHHIIHGDLKCKSRSTRREHPA